MVCFFIWRSNAITITSIVVEIFISEIFASISAFASSTKLLELLSRFSDFDKTTVFVAFFTNFDFSFTWAGGMSHLVAFPTSLSLVRRSRCSCCSRRCSSSLGEKISLSFALIVFLRVTLSLSLGLNLIQFSVFESLVSRIRISYQNFYTFYSEFFKNSRFFWG